MVKGLRGFPVHVCGTAFQCVWNSLPAHLCYKDIDYNSFKHELEATGFTAATGEQCDAVLNCTAEILVLN